MDYLIAVYQMTLERLRDYKLHPGVVSQLFCYLFFFTSTSVFNSLMSKGKRADIIIQMGSPELVDHKYVLLPNSAC